MTRSGVWQSLPGRQCHPKKKHTKVVKKKHIKKEFKSEGISMKIDQICETQEEGENEENIHTKVQDHDGI